MILAGLGHDFSYALTRRESTGLDGRGPESEHTGPSSRRRRVFAKTLRLNTSSGRAQETAQKRHRTGSGRPTTSGPARSCHQTTPGLPMMRPTSNPRDPAYPIFSLLLPMLNQHRANHEISPKNKTLAEARVSGNSTSYTNRFRRTPAMPRRPVPSKAMLDGSGVAGGGGVAFGPVKWPTKSPSIPGTCRLNVSLFLG